MNTPLRRLATVVLVMFVGLMASATWVQYFQADRLNNDSRNVRTLYREFGNARGHPYDRTRPKPVVSDAAAGRSP